MKHFLRPYPFISLPISISYVYIHYDHQIPKSQENHIQTISYRNGVFIIGIFRGWRGLSVLLWSDINTEENTK